MGVSIIIPIRNEDYIDKLTQEIIKEFLEIPFEILVISGNDINRYNSTNFKNIVVYGDSLERAILTGFSFAYYDNLIVMDGDGQHPPNIARKIYDALNDGCKLSYASRFVEGGSAEKMSIYRQFVSWGFKFISNLRGVPLSDPMAGFFGVKREIIDSIKFKPFKWKILCEIAVKMDKTKMIRIREIPYKMSHRVEGESHSSSIVALRIIWDLLWL